MQNASAAKTQAASFVWTQKLWQISETETETKVLTGIQNSFRGIFSLNQGARGVSIQEKVYYKRINVKNCVSRADHCQDGFLQLLTCSCTTVKVHTTNDKYFFKVRFTDSTTSFNDILVKIQWRRPIECSYVVASCGRVLFIRAKYVSLWTKQTLSSCY